MLVDMLRNARGIGDAALTFGSGIAAEPIAGLYGLGGALSGGAKGGAQNVEALRNALTYQPRTEEGADYLGAVGEGIEWVGDKLSEAPGAQSAQGAWEGFTNASPAAGAGLAAVAGVLDPTRGATRKTKTAARTAQALRHTRPDLPTIKAAEFKPLKGGATAYRKQLEQARALMGDQDRLQVDPLPDDFKGRVFTTDDGMQGFAITDEGTVTNLFRNPEAGAAGTMDAALTKARAEGAKNLEAFDTYLAEGYKKRGAVERDRSGFDPQYAPEGWDPATMGEPDYVAMDIGGYVPERKHSELAGPREQKPLERYAAPRGEPKRTASMFRGGNVPRLNAYVDKGVAQGAEKWYHLGGLKDRFIEELGPEKGGAAFDRFMDMTAALSPRSKVDQNLKRASVLYQREMQGQPISPLTHEMFPPGYGHLATTSAHAPAIKRLVETGAVGNSVDQPKIASFAENLKGNYEPLTSDTHNVQILSGQARSPTKAEYPFLESRQKTLGERRDLQPAEWQSALWTGAGDVTGVADVRNMTAAMNQRIAKTAEKLGISEQEAFREFAKGNTKLYQMLLATALGGGAYAASDEEAALDTES